MVNESLENASSDFRSEVKNWSSNQDVSKVNLTKITILLGTNE